MIKFPKTYRVHKKQAELQLSLSRPKDTEVDGKTVSEAGCLFLEIAKPLGEGTNKMDWENKLTMKLGVTDLGKILTECRANDKVSLIHKTEKDGVVRMTSLNVDPGENGTYKWLVVKTEGTAKKMQSVYFDSTEMFITFKLLEAAIPVILGWTE